MTKLQKIGFISFGIILAIFTGWSMRLAMQKKQSFGALPQVPALFETSLAVPMGTSDTSMTLASAALKGGATLSGYYCFTLDSNTSLTEYTCGTASATLPTLITGLTRGVDPVQGTSSVASLIFSHRAGADVRITDYPALTIFQQTLNGSLALPNPLVYNSIATTTLQNNINNLASVGYVNGVALSGAPNATTSLQGVAQFATALQTAAGVMQGSTGSFLMPANSNFASTSSATTLVPVTQTNGKLNQNFFDLTQGFTFTGTLTDINATTTLIATTTKPLVLDTIPYVFTNTQGSASTTLTNDGSGNLSWQPTLSFNSATSTTFATTFTNTTGSTTLAEIVTKSLPVAQRLTIYGTVPNVDNTNSSNTCELDLYIDHGSKAEVALSTILITTGVHSNANGNFTYVTPQLGTGVHTIDLAGVTSSNTCNVVFTQMSAFNSGN